MMADPCNAGRLSVNYNGTPSDAASTPGLFEVCTGCSRYYQNVYDLR